MIAVHDEGESLQRLPLQPQVEQETVHGIFEQRPQPQPGYDQAERGSHADGAPAHPDQKGEKHPPDHAESEGKPRSAFQATRSETI
jgi:hypothetical protein